MNADISFPTDIGIFITIRPFSSSNELFTIFIFIQGEDCDSTLYPTLEQKT